MSTARILIVHADPNVMALTTSMLQSLGHRIIEATSDRAAVRLLELEQGGVELIIAGADPYDPEALELLTYLRRKYPRVPVVLLFPVLHNDRAREARQRGAANVLKFPLPATQLRAAVAQALGTPEPAPAFEPRPATPQAPPMANGHNGHNNGHAHHHHVEPIAAAASQRRPAPAAEPTPTPRLEPAGLGDESGLIGDDPSLRQALELAEMIAPTKAPVLILGERGTGKSLLARTLHSRSPRRDGPFLELSCDTLKPPALEVEFFGRRGGYAELVADRPGKLALARGGTLFIDEISALSPELQFKLLRVLNEGEYEPVGSTQTARVDCRIVLGSRADLAALVEQGSFRQDLFYRMGVVTLKLPPLRHRGPDVVRLAEHFRARFARKLSKDVNGFTPEALDLLRGHDWPGNVHELESAVERGVVLCRGSKIEAAHLALVPPEARPQRPPAHTPRPHVGMGIRPLKEALEEPEKQLILQALEALNWNRQETARVLDINRTTLYKKMKKYKLLYDEPAWAS
ncbi:MAG TPA: sigma-54 dependent transcriptional regulator [Isosphaeraceae bacterium]|jgi:two-component system response regulator HydG|nr:sigma-54 dependent transcriptional regulator [Isosphaeraceae bacterium]